MDETGLCLAIWNGRIAFWKESIAECNASRETLHGFVRERHSDRLLRTAGDQYFPSEIPAAEDGTKEAHDLFLCRFILTLIKSIDDKDMGKRMAGRILGYCQKWTENEMGNLSIEGTRKDMRIGIHRLLDQMSTFRNGLDDAVRERWDEAVAIVPRRI